LKKLLGANKRLNTAYLLKESFGQLWSYQTEGWARRFFDNWKESRKIVFERMSKKLVTKKLDFDLMAEKSNYFTTADIIEVINSVAHKTFERELSSGKEYKSDTNDFIVQISSYKPTISKEEMETFRLDAREHCRTDYCHLY